LPEQEIRAKGFFGGQHAYDLSKNSGLPVLGQEDQQRKVLFEPFVTAYVVPYRNLLTTYIAQEAW